MIGILKSQLLKFIYPLDYHFEKEEIFKNEIVTKYTSYEVIYKLSPAIRKISFSVVDYYTHLRVSFFIYNTDGEPHTTLRLDRYLEEYCNVKDAKNIMLLDQYLGKTTEQKISCFFTHIKGYLNDRFFEILLGKDWVEIPTDWGDYK